MRIFRYVIYDNTPSYSCKTPLTVPLEATEILELKEASAGAALSNPEAKKNPRNYFRGFDSQNGANLRGSNCQEEGTTTLYRVRYYLSIRRHPRRHFPFSSLQIPKSSQLLQAFGSFGSFRPKILRNRSVQSLKPGYAR